MLSRPPVVGISSSSPQRSQYDDELQFLSTSSTSDTIQVTSSSQFPFQQPPELYINGHITSHSTSTIGRDQDFDDEDRPILEELGIDFMHIRAKTLQVLFPVKSSIPQELIHDADLAGPLVFCILLGIGMLFSGKLHFGYIYGFGVLGSVAMYIVANLMSQVDLSMDRIASVLGYSLLPITLLSFIGVFFNLNEGIGLIFSVICIFWSTSTATKFMEYMFQMSEQKYLLAYPVLLLYTCFALITIF
jgi:hypothetical protein